MLLCDPFYRTLMGLQILIEYQWVHFGHKFSSRLGLLGPKSSDETSPVFLQWLDCVWQLLRQKPHEFQFNETLLFDLAATLQATLFGTFLADTAKERAERWQMCTQSFWSHINSRSAQQQYLQSGFSHSHSDAPMWATAGAGNASGANAPLSSAPIAAPGRKTSGPTVSGVAADEWQYHTAALKICRKLHVYWT